MNESCIICSQGHLYFFFIDFIMTHANLLIGKNNTCNLTEVIRLKKEFELQTAKKNIIKDTSYSNMNMVNNEYQTEQ